MSSILDQVKERAGITDIPDAPPAAPQPRQSITDLLPKQCTAWDLWRELGVSAADRQALLDSNVKRVMGGDRDETAFFDSADVQRFITDNEIAWDRTEISMARDHLSPDEIFSPTTSYPGRLLPAELGISFNNLVFLLGRQNTGSHALPHYASGGQIVAALRRACEEKIPFWIDGRYIESVLKERKQAAERAVASDPSAIAAALAKHQAAVRAEQQREHAATLAEFGNYVRLKGDLNDQQLAVLADLLTVLGFTDADYRAAVADLEHIEHLQAIDSDEFRVEANARRAAAMDQFDALKKLEKELPQQIREKRLEVDKHRRDYNKSAGAAEQLRKLRETKPFLFLDAQA